MTTVWLALATAFLPLGQTGASTAPRVAVVSVPEASSQYLRTAELEAHFDTLQRKFNEEREAMRARGERMERSLQEELKPGTQEHRDRSRELAGLEAELRYFSEAGGRRLELELADALHTIFEDIQTAVREVAEELEIDLVLAADQMPPEKPESSIQVRQYILLQKVLYWNPRIDLTGDVIARLNAKHKARGAAPSPAVPSP